MNLRETHKPVLLFDGVCRFCNAFVQFTIKRDPVKFRFAPLQSVAGEALLRQSGRQNNLETFVYIGYNCSYDKSTAILNVVKGLTGLWPLLYIFILVPRPIRDAFYDLVARNRYRFLGKETACFIPTEDIKCRFLE